MRDSLSGAVPGYEADIYLSDVCICWKCVNSSRRNKMSPIKDLTLTYEALNKQDVFTSGDTVTGLVTFILTKETKFKSLVVKITGEGSVHWTHGVGDDRRTYRDHRRYIRVKEYLIKEDSKGRKKIF